MDNIPLINGQRLATVKRTSGGVVVHRPLYQSATGVAASEILIAPLKLGGSGSTALNVDGHVTSAVFWHVAAASKFTTIRSLSMMLSDSGLIAGGFGGLDSLTNGLAVDLVDTDGVTVSCDLTGGLGIKNHGDLCALGAEVQILETASGVDLVAVRWNFPAPIELTAAQRFRVTVRDDLTGLAAARAFVAGEMLAA